MNQNALVDGKRCVLLDYVEHPIKERVSLRRMQHFVGIIAFAKIAKEYIDLFKKKILNIFFV